MVTLLRMAALVCIAVVLAAAGCSGGGDDQPLGEYLAALDSAEDETQTALDRAVAKYNAAIAEPRTDEEVVDAFREVVRATASITERNYGDFRQLVPPLAVEVFHNDAQGAASEVILLILDLQGRAELAESSADVEALLTEMNSGPEFSAARERLQTAICVIQAIGLKEGFDAQDIGCEE